MSKVRYHDSLSTFPTACRMFEDPAPDGQQISWVECYAHVELGYLEHHASCVAEGS